MALNQKARTEWLAKRERKTVAGEAPELAAEQAQIATVNRAPPTLTQRPSPMPKPQPVSQRPGAPMAAAPKLAPKQAPTMQPRSGVAMVQQGQAQQQAKQIASDADAARKAAAAELTARKEQERKAAEQERNRTDEGLDELVRNLIASQLERQGGDTADEEALIREAMEQAAARDVRGNRARMGAAGFGLSGAAPGIEADIMRQARQAATREILGVREREDDEAWQRATEAVGLEARMREAGLDEFLQREVLKALGAEGKAAREQAKADREQENQEALRARLEAGRPLGSQRLLDPLLGLNEPGSESNPMVIDGPAPAGARFVRSMSGPDGQVANVYEYQGTFYLVGA